VSSKCSDPRVLGLLLVVMSTTAQAQVNRCTGPQGQVRYSDRACEAQGLARDAEASRRLSGVRVEYYDVTGVDGGALSASLAQRGPKGFHGLTDWEFRYDYRVAPTPEGTCRVTGVRTSVTGRILVPRWVDEPKAPKALREAWSTYMDALMKHEEGHMATGQSLTRALQSDIGAATGPDCKTLRADVERLAQGLIDGHQARDQRYDAETQHGATQGARFTPP
jgi:predicted secreted Zn-dependent protease